ncbi:DUF4177 domain-containing protein [Roseovarius atlanticus]|uniref:DUF4177 domain-containing protein n=1 Tax=Roseovarius atlanticus TaxID=1641875 RepID=UPI0021BDA006|nr:DUF4177 domain-containing protein [Roseovarius atlanticus]
MIQKYEYKVIPAPAKGRKGPGIKGAEGRFAHGLETAINELALEGWEYLRADILPSEERQGLTSSQTVYRSMLVFRRPLELEGVDSPPPLPWDDHEEEALETAAEADEIEDNQDDTPDDDADGTEDDGTPRPDLPPRD